MRYILRTCKGRESYVDYIAKQIPSVEICFDDRGGAMWNFIKSLEITGDDPVVNIEDDIVITKNFQEKAMAVINEKPDSVIQFFSMRKADKTIGSRWDSGASYLMAQCTYFPSKVSKGLLAYSKKYDRIDHKSQPLDSMVADYLKKTKQRYWIHCPSLVDHRVGVSMIDSRRAKTNRQSFTFEDPANG
tara:strand:- start:1368 stop:1931 length:564 start_codon:yes stop_codon:yes gene_type:complete